MKTAHNGAVDAWQWALALKPLVLFALAGLVLYPIRRAVMRWWPEGRIKRLLLLRVNDRGQKTASPDTIQSR